jgi:hypothetical protein
MSDEEISMNKADPGVNLDLGYETVTMSEQMYLVIVNGIPWVDADGRDEWNLADAEALANSLHRLHYENIELEAE